MEATEAIRKEKVSILVILELALEVVVYIRKKKVPNVSILVILELALEEEPVCIGGSYYRFQSLLFWNWL